MKNKKILLLVLTCALFIFIYFVNQLSFLQILSDPDKSEYRNISDSFDAYLLADTNEYIEIANSLNDNLKSCTIFVDSFAGEAMYSDACAKEDVTYVSESINNSSQNVKHYDSIYEYIYGIKSIQPIAKLTNGEYVRFNEILVDSNVGLDEYLPADLNYSQEKVIYSQYSNEYIHSLIAEQKVLIITLIIALFVIFIAGYVRVKRHEFAIYELLGLDDSRMLCNLIYEYWLMSSMCFLIAQGLSYLLVELNGKVYYLAMYFEYWSLSNAVITYIGMLVLILPIIIIIYGLTVISPIEKRLQWLRNIHEYAS